MMTPTGINLIGPASSNVGQGVVLREYAKTLIANGHPVSILDLDVGGGRSGLDMSLQAHFAPDIESLPHDINLWLFGGQAIDYFAQQICKGAYLRSKFNAASVWWELPDVPPLWATCAQAFDAVLAASGFIKESWANSVPHTPVLFAPVPLALPAHISPDRARFGLPEEPLLFYTGFEAGSDPVRKNPFAILQAFRQAFPTEIDVRLVIKVNNPEVAGKLHDEMAKLYALIDGDARVLLLRDRLSHVDLLSLYDSCDVIVSLHRAEGLGLIPLEAMRLGKPVIATGWSGNMTYMNHSNAALVRYGLVPTDESSHHYAPSKTGIPSKWADPDVTHAAQWMRALASDSALRQSMGQRARMDSLHFDQAARRADFVEELVALHSRKSVQMPKNYAAIGQSITKALAREYRRLNPKQDLPLTAKAWATLREQFDRHVAWRFRQHE